MGVPFFFGQILQNHRDIAQEAEKGQETFDWVMPDTNGIIHPICQEVLEQQKGKPSLKKLDLEYNMCCKVVQHLKLLVIISGSKNLFIAIDGPPPGAKIKQQRSRRFKSAQDRILKNRLRKKWNLEPEKMLWNTAAITPGTGFMKRLAWLIETKIKKKWFGKDVHVEFSSAAEPGEGEHKIKHKIDELFQKAQKQNVAPPKIAVDGLDADLLFLTMVSGCPNIRLIREKEQVFGKPRFQKQQYEHSKRHQSQETDIEQESSDSSDEESKDNTKKNSKSTESVYSKEDLEEARQLLKRIVYVNMDKVRKYAIESMPRLNGLDDQEVLREWIILCYFLGNDFLPHFPSLHVRHGGLETLIEAYRDVKLRLVTYDDELKRWTLNPKAVQLIAMELGNGEVWSIQQYEKDRYNKLQRGPRNNFGNRGRGGRGGYNRNHNQRGGFQQPQSYEEELNNLEQLRYPIKDTVRVGQGDEDKWKYNYYTQFMHTDDFKKVAEYCYEYFKGLIWVANYYFNDCIDWNWFYPLDHAPFLSDFGKCKFKDHKIKFSLGEPVKPKHQLLLCLPRHSSELIPEKYRDLIDKKGQLEDLYPEEVQEDFLWKDMAWQAIPMLPKYDPERVLKYAKRVDSKKSTDKSDDSSSDESEDSDDSNSAASDSSSSDDEE
jgi:5'-3' exoribonuclease 2